MDSTASPVIKLEGQKNWSIWKFQVTVILRGAELFSVVNGTEKQADNVKTWASRDAKAQTIIVSRLSEAAIVHVLTCETAEAMWKKLNNVYEASSATSTLMLQQRFFQYKYEDGDLSTYLSKLQEMACQLKQAGEEVSEKFLITKVLMSLPDSYSHFICAWESVESSKQNYDALVARLLVEEERLKAREKDDKVQKGENSALYAHQNKKQFTKKCYKCGKGGHYSQQCRSKSEKRKCFECNKIGHLKHECPKNQNYNKNNLNSYSNSSTKRGNAFTMTAMTSKYQSDVNVNRIKSENRQSVCQKWLIDSGASEHMSSERSLFTNYHSVSNRFVIVGDGRRLRVLGVGEIKLQVYDGDCYAKSTLYNVLHVPDMHINLFSVPCITRRGYEVKMLSEKCIIYKDNELCAIGNLQRKSYVLDVLYDGHAAAVSTLSTWHERLCHQNIDYVKRVLNSNNIQYKNVDFQCECCLQGKSHRLPFSRKVQHTTKTLEIVHADVCGPMEVESVGGSRYFLLLRDDYSNYRVVYFLKKKRDTVYQIKQFVTWAETQTDNKVKVIRTDNGGEFVNKDMQDFVKEKGIQHQTTIPYTPQQNGKAERDMRTIVEAARSMIGTNLSKELWAEAVNTAVYVLNRTTKSTKEGQSPYETFNNRKFDVLILRGIFGQEVYAHIPKEKRLKWDAKGEKAIFVGYDDSKGYRLYYEDKREVHTKRDIIFLDMKSDKEGEMPNVQDIENVILLDIPEENDEHESESEDEFYEIITKNEETGEGQGEERDQEIENVNEDLETEQVRSRSGRIIKKPSYLKDYNLYAAEPKNYKEAMMSSDAENWKEAIKKELDQLEDKETWTKIDNIPEGKEVISSKWVLKRKEDSYKARLVARGFEQGYVDNVYAPVAKLNTFRIFVSVATKLGLEIKQMDVWSFFKCKT